MAWSVARAAAILVGPLLVAGCMGGGTQLGAPYISPDFAVARERFTPRPGVTCDRRDRVCWDRNGANLALTREEFGRDAERRLARWLDKRPGRDTTYSPARGVRCDVADELCLRRGDPSYARTRQQFGKKAAVEVREPGWGEDEIRPSRRVVCDVASETCLKNGRLDGSSTGYVFGRKAKREVNRQKRLQ